MVIKVPLKKHLKQIFFISRFLTKIEIVFKII